jgi:type I restriction enzyme M protein
MLPSDVRQVIDIIWDKIWSSGISNPLTAIEYLTVVLLLRQAPAATSVHLASSLPSWEATKRLVESRDAESIAKSMVLIQQAYGIGASPEISSPSAWRDIATLREIMSHVDRLTLSDRNHDILGDIFEYVLNHLSTAGHFGQFRTPRHLIQFIVEVLDPTAGEKVLDPACGTAGFLIAAREHRGGANGSYHGIEVDSTVARIARTNALVHGLGHDSILHADSFQLRDRDADVILANPPFAGSITLDRVSDFKSGTQKSELLFLELMMNRLRPGGRAGVVVPSSVLTSSSSGPTWIRRQLVESNDLKAVVELPSGVFRPYTDVRTAVLVWANSRPGHDVIMIKVESDGHSLDDRRGEVEQNDLPAALALLRGHDEAQVPHSRVSLSVIANNRYILSPSRYIQSPDAEPAYFGPSVADAVGSVKRELFQLSAILEELERSIHD